MSSLSCKQHPATITSQSSDLILCSLLGVLDVFDLVRRLRIGCVDLAINVTGLTTDEDQAISFEDNMLMCFIYTDCSNDEG